MDHMQGDLNKAWTFNPFLLTLFPFEHQIDNGRRLAWCVMRLSLYKYRSGDHMQGDSN